mmetsp:Transcript_62800/g.198892  ORF Transcript_62800/g.198892 Transcript_62800/m.198892 type:complete len:287 (-) Transcript_62800:2989-3849(-)
MPASTCTSHFSTAPLALDGWITVLSLISSPSSERMAVMSALPGWNSRVEMASKHFFKCGCTLVGSFVSERISSISSLERKKKRGKKSRFFSRYAASPFWMASRSALHSISLSRRSRSRAMGITSGASEVRVMMSRHWLSTSWNFWPSSGICLRMSALEKMGSRYSHVLWHLSQLSSMSCRVVMACSHSVLCSLKGLAKGEAFMLCTLTIWSSRMVWISSVPPRMKVPVSLYGRHPKTMPSHSDTIFSRLLRREYSLEAVVPMFSTASSLSMTPRRMRSSMQNSMSL